VAVGAVALGCRKKSPDELVSRGVAATATPTGTGTTPTTTATAAPPAPASLKSQVLQAFADCTIANVRAFEDKARALDAAAQAYAATRSDSNRDAAREAWRSAMATWQELEVAVFGPAAPAAMPGGKGLRDEIYAYPLFNRCQVEEQLVSLRYAGADFAQTLITSRGLAAFEYLVFYTGTDNVCSSFSPINGQGTWAKLAPTELQDRKAAYAAAVAKDVLSRATALRQAWEPQGGNFYGELTRAGAGSKTFATDAVALNAVSDALFYIDDEAKDLKIGKPAGIYDCPDGNCGGSVESPYAKASGAHLQANLRGFRRLFEGCGADGAGLGFDDVLVAVGTADLASRMKAALATSTTELGPLAPTYEAVALSNPSQIKSFHTTLKGLTDVLKTEFVTVLNLELPKASEGDND
jgi:predicted lipoprotein